LPFSPTCPFAAHSISPSVSCPVLAYDQPTSLTCSTLLPSFRTLPIFSPVSRALFAEPGLRIFFSADSPPPSTALLLILENRSLSPPPLVIALLFEVEMSISQSFMSFGVPYPLNLRFSSPCCGRPRDRRDAGCSFPSRLGLVLFCICGAFPFSCPSSVFSPCDWSTMLSYFFFSGTPCPKFAHPFEPPCGCDCQSLAGNARLLHSHPQVTDPPEIASLDLLPCGPPMVLRPFIYSSFIALWAVGLFA